MSKGKSEHQTKNEEKNGNQLPQRQVLSQSTTKLFITQKETRYSFPIRSKAQNVGALEKILSAQQMFCKQTTCHPPPLIAMTLRSEKSAFSSQLSWQYWLSPVQRPNKEIRVTD